MFAKRSAGNGRRLVQTCQLNEHSSNIRLTTDIRYRVLEQVGIDVAPTEKIEGAIG